MSRAAPLPPDERRAAIMAATEPLLEIHGRNVSTRQIAEAAGIAEGTIFRVFPSKETLIDSVLEDAFDARITCEELLGIDPEGDLEQRLVEAVTVLQERLRRVFALFHSMALTRDGPPHADMRARQREDNELLNAALAALIGADGSRLAHSPEDAASLLRTLTFSITHPILSDGRHSEPAQIVELLLHGIIRRDCATSPDARMDHTLMTHLPTIDALEAQTPHPQLTEAATC